MTDTCIIVKNITDYYGRRNRTLKKKYGDLFKESSRIYMLCEESRCVNPDHMVLQEFIFTEYGKKQCTKCKRWLPEYMYYEDQKTPSKTTAKCRQCIYKPKKES